MIEAVYIIFRNEDEFAEDWSGVFVEAFESLEDAKQRVADLVDEEFTPYIWRTDRGVFHIPVRLRVGPTDDLYDGPYYFIVKGELSLNTPS